MIYTLEPWYFYGLMVFEKLPYAVSFKVDRLTVTHCESLRKFVTACFML